MKKKIYPCDDCNKWFCLIACPEVNKMLSNNLLKKG
jgi:hypothetical protein